MWKLSCLINSRKTDSIRKLLKKSNMSVLLIDIRDVFIEMQYFPTHLIRYVMLRTQILSALCHVLQKRMYRRW